MRISIGLLSSVALSLGALLPASGAAADSGPSASASLFGAAGVSSTEGRAVGAAAASKRLDLSLLLRADDDGLTRYANAVSNPDSPLFGRHLTPGQVLARFGPSQADRARVAAWLRSKGLPAKTAPGGFAVDTRVTVALAQRLFSVRLGAFRSSAGDSFVAPVRAASLPASLRGSVVGVNGLSDRPVAQTNSAIQANAQAAQAAQALQPVTPQQGKEINSQVRKQGSSLRANLGTQAGCAEGRATGTPLATLDPDLAGSYVPAYTPNQYLDAYGVKRLHDRGFKGQGQRIALIEIDGFKRSDLTTAAKCFGFRAPPTTIRTVGGVKKPLAPGGENTLDLQVLAAVAPSLKEIVVMQGSSSSYGLNLQYSTAVSLPSSRRPNVISSSIGSCEIFNYQKGPYVRQLERTLKQAAAQGMTVVAATGDTGSTGCSIGGGNDAAIGIPSAGFPASSPWVTGVGGTNFTLDARNQITEEVVWNNAPILFGAGNGGPSLMFRQPSWQQGPGVGVNNGARSVPDIAMLADQFPGYAIYCTATDCGDGGWLPVGGTSAATPLLGGILALANQQAHKAGQPRLGFINPSIYRLAAKKSSRQSVFRDITKVGNDLGVMIGPADLGDNQPVGCCAAGRYYDMASGWGSVRAPQFSSQLRGLGR